MFEEQHQANSVLPATRRADSRSPATSEETPVSVPATERAEVVRFVDEIFAEAIRQRASDVHFEPFEHEFRVRWRVDGALRDAATPPLALARPVTSRLKVLANVNLAEQRLPQDGRIRLAIGGQKVDFRLSTLPTQFGESVVLRVLDQSAGRLELSELGLPAALRERVAALLQRPHGIIIVTGPTGSGKTTTLYSFLQRLNAPDAKLLTIEDPVEYEIEGIMQVAVNPVAGLSFARAMRSFLRHDPDIVMVGEIRDAETAQIAIQASLTGHLVLTTLHTNDAASAITRLTDMGIEPFLLASTVEMVLAQRLLRRVCPDCRVPYEPETSIRAHAGLPAEMPSGRSIYKAAGCPACQQSGYRGRIGLFELLLVDESIRELIATRASLMELRAQASAKGLVTLRQAGIAAVLAGETTIEEILKYT